jgi:hypothetical protein
VCSMKKIVMVILAVIVISMFSGCIETGKGYATDTVYGCELQGLVWKTWSCWLTNDHPSMGKDGSTYSAIYSLSKDDTALINQMDALASEKVKRTVRVYYRNEAWVWPWDYSSGTIIYKIEV